MRITLVLTAFFVVIAGCGVSHESQSLVQLPEPSQVSSNSTQLPPVTKVAKTTTVEVAETAEATTTPITQINDLISWEGIELPDRMATGNGETPSVQPPGNQIFAYAPATFFIDQDEATFYCGNKADNNGTVIDSIMRDDGKTAVEVMATTKGAWDSAHVCDPDVVEGNFNYQGVSYRWAMAYTGTKDPEGKGYQNQVGLAFSNDLTVWVKYPLPIVNYNGPFWGVGQPSLVSVDNGGQVLLFYTQGVQSGTTTRAIHLDLSDVTNGPRVLTPSWEIPINGLLRRSDGELVLHNGEFAYDTATDRFLVIRPSEFNQIEPQHIAASLEIAEISARDLWGGSGSWSSIKVISAAETGFGKNHNGGIATDTYGRIRDAHKLHVKFTGTPNMDQGDPIWWYDIYEMIVLLPGR